MIDLEGLVQHNDGSNGYPGHRPDDVTAAGTPAPNNDSPPSMHRPASNSEFCSQLPNAAASLDGASARLHGRKYPKGYWSHFNLWWVLGTWSCVHARCFCCRHAGPLVSTWQQCYGPPFFQCVTALSRWKSEEMRTGLRPQSAAIQT